MALLIGYAFLITYIIILALFGGFYVWAFFKKSYNSVDIVYGAAFPLAAILMGLFGGSFFSGNKLIVALLVLFWGARIAIMLTLRKYGKDEKTGEDRRFKEYRDKFGKDASWKGFLILYLPQTLLVMIVGFPVYAVTFEASTYGWEFLTGIIIWVIGFAFELVADLQMWKFKANAENKEKIMQSGLWKYSMHPNYFGEILQWVGFFFVGLTSPRPWFQVLGLLSPIAIWASLMFLSGIPQQDKRFTNNEIYQEYRRNTNRLIPWFKKSAYSRKD
jgi:steroid 5-alpha reductase family enzyme